MGSLSSSFSDDDDDDTAAGVHCCGVQRCVKTESLRLSSIVDSCYCGARQIKET